MLTAILWLMFGLWLLGVISGYTAGGLIHVLAVTAIVVALVRAIQRRRVGIPLSTHDTAQH